MKLLAYFFFICFLCHVESLYADGSKDFYPSGVRGNRAFLISREANQANVFFNRAAHYVYGRQGETIAIASSVQGIGNGHMVLTDPNGRRYSTINSPLGRISANNLFTRNRDAELAGPRVGYQSFEVPVGAGQEGVWKVEFFPAQSGQERLLAPVVVRADEEWGQDESLNIAAWDISVRDLSNSYWVKGRVYTNVLNLYINGLSLDDEQGAFYGKNYVLTKDGYIYRVDGNGSHGIHFFYFVNSSGFLNSLNEPTYKSWNNENTAVFQNPNDPDQDLHVTHKMLYTFPDITMPAQSRGQVPGGSTWLYQQTTLAVISDIGFRSIEFSNYLNKKGGYIAFRTNYAGRYKITISPVFSDYNFENREIIVDAVLGLNSFLWDGLDGSGTFVPAGKDYPVDISISLLEGEVHFPYFDMEINPKGILVERMHADGTADGAATLYWDDSDISAGLQSERSNPLINLAGISSFVNGHGWGTYRHSFIPNNNYQGNDDYGAFSFGNNKAMDTWSYSNQVEQTKRELITVQVSDLSIESFVANKDTIMLGEEVVYSIVIKNDGPSEALGARFEYSLPAGFLISHVSTMGSCAVIRSMQSSQNELHAVVDMPSGCALQFTLTAKSLPVVPDATYGYLDALSGVLRPLGYTDPDATSADVLKSVLGTAFEECIGNCNNLRLNKDVFLLEPYNERGQLSLLKSVRHIDVNHSGFQESGDILEYTFTVRNVGMVHVRDIYIADVLLSPQPIVLNTTVLQPGQETSITQQYFIQSDDVIRKFVENSATVFGKNPRNFAVKDISGTRFDNDVPTRIAIDAKPFLAITKLTSNRGTGEANQFTIGDTISYAFEIKHEGDVIVKDIMLLDHNISNQSFPVTRALSNNLISYSLKYVIQSDDINKGLVTNSALVTATDVKYGNVLTDSSGQSFFDNIPTHTVLAKPPIGVADNFEVYQGLSGDFDVVQNDQMGSSTLNPESILVIVQPTSGVLSVINGRLFYTPNSNFTYGDHSFIYRVYDRSRLSTAETQAIIHIMRTIPTAVDDFYRVHYNGRIHITPAENDYVGFSEILKETVTITDHPQHGIVQLLENGMWQYSPDYNYTGQDQFRYIVRDKNGNWSEEATVHIEVEGLFLPNVITPNGDSLNETFQVLGMYKYDRVELEVLNRNGQRLFFSEDYKNDWVVPDYIPEGTYFYIFKGIKLNQKPVIYRGGLLLKRTPYTN